jgi:hypothetical protein
MGLRQVGLSLSLGKGKEVTMGIGKKKAAEAAKMQKALLVAAANEKKRSADPLVE